MLLAAYLIFVFPYFQHIPALGRSDVQSSAIRQHYYPEVLPGLAS